MFASDGRAEVRELQRKGLRGLDPRRDDIAGAIAELVFAEGLRIGEARSRVEDTYRLVRGVVVDDHLLRPDDRRAPELARSEPRQLDMRNRARGIAQVDEADVRDAGQDAAPAEGRDLLW